MHAFVLIIACPLYTQFSVIEPPTCVQYVGLRKICYVCLIDTFGAPGPTTVGLNIGLVRKVLTTTVILPRLTILAPGQTRLLAKLEYAQCWHRTDVGLPTIYRPITAADDHSKTQRTVSLVGRQGDVCSGRSVT